jgi:hypothetical protein
MRTRRKRLVYRQFRLDVAKIRRAQKILSAKTETEAIERALDAAIAERKHDRLAARANKRFMRSGIEIRDVFGKLAK